jgi:predicted CXXCH cytochrome family protein
MDSIQMKKTGLISLAILLLSSASVYALDPPHNETAIPLIECDSCHIGHTAPGTGLTTTAGNANLCQSCHVSGGQASALPLLSSEQAVPGTSGVHHRWDAVTPVPTAEAMADRLENGTTIMCSTCHDQHLQLYTPFDPAASPTPGDAGRHFQRVANDTNQMCKDCHADRNLNSVRTWISDGEGGGELLSHPVGVALPSGDPKFHDAPKEPNGSPQTGGPSFAGNGTGDTNPTNNLILDAGGLVQCTTCHSPHYADSDPNTVDGP